MSTASTLSVSLLVVGLGSACAGPETRAVALHGLAPLPRPEPAAAASVTRVSDVRAAVRLSLEHNPNLRIAQARVEAARAALDGTRALLAPHVSAQLAVLGGDAPSTYLFKTIDARALKPGTDFNDPGSFENTEVALALRWNLWNGGRDEWVRDGARRDVEAGDAAHAAARNALVAAVVGAWLEARAADELILGDAARVRTLESQVRELAVLVAGGAALRSDLLSLEVRLAQARERATLSALGRRTALAVLHSLLAAEPQLEIDTSAATDLAPSSPATLAAAQEAARAQRGELSAARAAFGASRARLEAAQRARLPRLDLEARLWGDDDAVGLDFARANGTVGVALNFDVFDAGARASGVAGARAASFEAEARLAAIEADVALDVERCWVRLEAARTRVDVAEQAVGSAGENLALIERQRAGGAATVSRYLEAEGDRAQADVSLVLARLDLERAAFELTRSVGATEDMRW